MFPLEDTAQKVIPCTVCLSQRAHGLAQQGRFFNLLKYFLCRARTEKVLADSMTLSKWQLKK